MRSCHIYLSVSGISFRTCPPGSFILLQMTECHFLSLTNIPLYFLYLFVCWGTQVVSTPWLLGITFPWTWKCTYLLKTGSSFPSDGYTEVRLLDDIVLQSLIFWGTSIIFAIMATPISISTNTAQGFPFLHIFCNTYFFEFLIIAILTVISTSL